MTKNTKKTNNAPKATVGEVMDLLGNITCADVTAFQATKTR